MCYICAKRQCKQLCIVWCHLNGVSNEEHIILPHTSIPIVYCHSKKKNTAKLNTSHLLNIMYVCFTEKYVRTAIDQHNSGNKKNIEYRTLSHDQTLFASATPPTNRPLAVLDSTHPTLKAANNTYVTTRRASLSLGTVYRLVAHAVLPFATII